MENLLLKKLQVKPGFKVKVVNAPENFPNIFGNIPPDVNLTFGGITECNVLLIFAITKKELFKAIDEELNFINKNIICWVLYPKTKSKLANDLNLMMSWEELKGYNLTPCASASINETWTALRIKPADDKKKSGQGNAEIQTNDYGNYVDVTNKIVTLPEDLKIELQKATQAYNFYESLSYSNRKEYVLWVITAKQDKTRLDRIQKTVDKLLAGKKNPNEK